MSSLHKDYHSTPTLPTEICASTTRPELFAPKSHETSNVVVERNAKNAKSFAADFEFGSSSLAGQNDRDSKVGDMRGYFTLPGRHKKMLDEGGSYRAVTKVRPVTTRSNFATSGPTSMAPPPPDHPPPPPPGQVVAVDPKCVSDYAKVSVKSPDRDAEMSPRSSFKPTDNAKLYASPENVQSVAFRSEEDSPTHRNCASNAANEAPKKRSPIRANSMPPRPNRPIVLKRNVPDIPLAAPAAAPAPVETYCVNGVNYTTYTTFRSPMTPDDPPPGEVGADQEDLTPTAERLLEGPVIPEPDYDQSDHEYNGSECSGSQYNGFRSSSVDETPSRTLEKKKKKSVSFVMNEEVAAKLQQQQQRNSAKKQQESILKDPQRDRERQLQQQEWSRPPLVKEKYMQQIEKIPMARLRFEPPPLHQHQMAPPSTAPHRVQHQIVSQQELPVLQKIRVSDEDKIRIEVPPVVPAKNVLARSNSSASGSATSAATKLALHKSQSFCAEKLQSMAAVPIATQSPAESGGPISESDIQKARSQLKPSRSFPHDFKNVNGRKNNDGNTTVVNEEGDNSSSGVSSDQENGSTGKFVTYLPVDGGATSTVVTDNASESSDDVSEKSWILQAEKDQMGHSIVSMKKLLHPKLQAIFDAPLATSQNKLMTTSAGPAVMQSHLDYAYTTQTLPNRGHHHHHHHQQQQHKNPAKSVLMDERSIDQSLALINKHVKNLNMNEAPEETGLAVLAPPPGFSDSESFSDNDSLSSSGSQRRFGIRGIPKSSRNLPVQSSLTDQLKKERMTTNLMSRSVDSAQLMSANFATLPRKQVQHHQQQQQMLHASTTREFRTKPLIGWTVVDVCDWLDSLFMSEYKAAFINQEVDGLKLASMTKKDLESLGVIRIGHTMNIEKSLKRYLSPN